MSKLTIKNKITTKLLEDLTTIYSCACIKPSLIRLHVSSSMKMIFSSSAKSTLKHYIAVNDGKIISYLYTYNERSKKGRQDFAKIKSTN